MTSRCFVGLALTLVAGVSPARGQGSDRPPPYDPERARLAAQINDPEEATRAYLESVPAERRERTKAYADGEYALRAVGVVYLVLALLTFLGTGLSAGLRNAACRVTRFPALQAAVYGVGFVVYLDLVQFPLTYYESYLREKQFGLLSQDLRSWLVDQAKGLAVGAAVTALLLAGLYAVLRRTSRTWWLWGWAVVMAFVIVGMAVAPVYIQPLFNKFTPVPDGPVRQRVLELAKAQGVPADDVFEMDASRRSDKIGAYVAGLLGTTRVVLLDTLLRRCDLAQVEFVAGHEMGHYVLNHVWKGVAAAGVVTLAGFVLLRALFPRVAARWRSAGITGVADPAGLPLLILFLVVFITALSPALNTFSRTIEAEADHFGLEATGQADAAATAFLLLGEYRDLDPDPVIEALFFDHPSGRNRIRAAMEFKRAHPSRAAAGRPGGLPSAGVRGP